MAPALGCQHAPPWDPDGSALPSDPHGSHLSHRESIPAPETGK